MILKHVWVPSKHSDASHHFIIARDGESVSVAWELASHERGQVTNVLTGQLAEEADAKVEWYLPPDAVRAWRAQRASGWDGARPGTSS